MNTIKSPIIIENLLSEKYMDRIEDSCIKSHWKYINNITYGENYEDIINGFTNSFDDKSVQYFLYQYLIFKICEKINFKVEKIIRIRKRLTYPSEKKYNIAYHPHVDHYLNHLVLVYYVNESDGDTYIYKEKSSTKNKYPKNFSILEKIKFKRGNVLVFNGKNYHASSLSSKNNRIILNISISGKFEE